METLPLADGYSYEEGSHFSVSYVNNKYSNVLNFTDDNGVTLQYRNVTIDSEPYFNSPDIVSVLSYGAYVLNPSDYTCYFN